LLAQKDQRRKNHEQDTAESIGSYVGGENLSMQGEQHEILTALEALRRVFKPE
jgi:hypothetical protein